MKLQVKRRDLDDAIKTICPFISGKVEMPYLKDIRLNAVDDLLVVSGSNLEVFTDVMVPAEVDQIGMTHIPNKMADLLLRALGGEVITIEGDRALKCRSGDSSITIQSSPINLWPEFPKIDTKTTVVMGEAEVQAVNMAARVGARDPDDYMRIGMSENRLHVTGTDRRKGVALNPDIAQSVVVRASTIGLLRIDPGALLSVGKRLWVQTENAQYSIGLFGKEMPNPSRTFTSIESHVKYRATIDAQHLHGISSAIALMNPASVRMEMKSTKGRIWIESHEAGVSIRDSLEVKGGVAPSFVGILSANHVSELLTGVKGDIEIGMTGENDVVAFRFCNGEIFGALAQMRNPDAIQPHPQVQDREPEPDDELDPEAELEPEDCL